MTKSELFKAAHAMARKVIQAGDDYRATFGAALKILLSKPSLLEQLIAIGGALWEKAGMRRIYFNNAAELYGLTYSTYKTGNISSARLDGEEISNSQASKILNKIGKIYFDLADDKIKGDRWTSQDTLNVIAARIRTQLV